MAVIYLRHPRHGAKVAISDMEAENDMQNGWEEYDPTELVNEPAPDAVVVAENTPPAPAPEPVNELLQPRRRSRRTQEAEQ